MYAKGGPIVPDPKKQMMTADQKFNANAKSREAENLTEMRNALKPEGKEALAKFDKELAARGFKVVKRPVKKMMGGGMASKKMAYAKGGQVKTHYQTAGRVQLPSGYGSPEEEADFLARCFSICENCSGRSIRNNISSSISRILSGLILILLKPLHQKTGVTGLQAEMPLRVTFF
jgi:hypothetical protein